MIRATPDAGAEEGGLAGCGGEEDAAAGEVGGEGEDGLRAGEVVVQAY